MKSISIESLDIMSCSSVSYFVSSVVVLLCWCIVVLVYCCVGVLLDVHTWSTYILSSCCIVMLSYVHTWSTHLHSILLRDHMWELHWYAAADDDDGDNDNGQQHTLNLYVYLILTFSPHYNALIILTMTRAYRRYPICRGSIGQKWFWPRNNLGFGRATISVTQIVIFFEMYS